MSVPASPLGTLLGRSWHLLRPSWRRLGPSWGLFGPSGRSLGGRLRRLGAIFGASWAVLECGKPNRREHEKRRKTYGKVMNFDSWGSPGEPLGGLLDRFGGSLGVLGRSFGDSRPSWTVLWIILGPYVPPGSASTKMVQHGAVFGRLPPAFRPWPGPCPGGSPPRPPQGDTQREPLRQ
eukprot:35885-Pyramimonas_sp.AAC.1